MATTARPTSPRHTNNTPPNHNSATGILACVPLFRILASLCVLAYFIQAAEKPEPPGWFAGDAHVHVDCGVAAGVTVTPEDILAAMKINDLALVSLMADMGNGEVRDAARDLPKINGKDFALST